MKIFYVSNNQLPTIKAHGIQIVKTCEALAESGAEVELIIPDRGLYPAMEGKDLLDYYGIRNKFKITKLSSKSLFNLVSNRYLSKVLFWVQQYLFSLRVSAYLKNKPGVVYTRDPFIIYSLRNEARKLFWEAHNFPRAIDANFYRSILKSLSGLIVISESLRKSFSGYYAGEILVASDGVDLERFSLDINKTEARGKVDLPSGKRLVLYAGHLYKWKGIPTLIKAVEFFPDDALLVVVGGTPDDLKKYSNMIRELPYRQRILLLGHRDYGAIPFFLRAADVLVLPNSAREPISNLYTSPLKLFEYMASGRPIVASDIPSIREILNAGNSFLVKADDPAALGDGIVKALNNEETAAKLAQKAKNDVGKYSWQNRALALISFMEKETHRTSDRKMTAKKILFDSVRAVVKRLPKGKTAIINLSVGILGSGYNNYIRIGDGRYFYIKNINSLNRSLFFLGDYENETTELVRKIIKPGMSILDVGCNFGWYTTLFSNLTGKDGRVWAFDISGRVLESLNKTLLANGMNNVKVERIALGDKEGVVEFFDSVKQGTANLRPEILRENILEDSVLMMRADEYFEKAGIWSIDFIKCDIDGAEMMFLSGAKNIISSNSALLIELSDSAQKVFGHSVWELASAIRNYGYKLYKVVEGYPELTDNDIESLSSVNVICLSPQKHGDMLRSLRT